MSTLRNDMKRRNPSSIMSPVTSDISKAAPPSSGRAASTFSRTNFYEQQSSPRSPVRLHYSSAVSSSSILSLEDEEDHKDVLNYILLVALYTLQGIPMGLSASIPFLIQQKIRTLASSTAQQLAGSVMTSNLSQAAAASSAAARSTYNANAIFALCSWPFSLKLLWAPIVDSCFLRRFGRRKSWIVPVQALAGALMVGGANFVERQLGLSAIGPALAESINVRGVTAFFFVLYFLMATQDIAVDGWALTMLSKKNRGRGPICNSIGQNIGYFLSFVGFLALNDAESCEMLWRPLLGLKSNPERGLVSLGDFIRSMGYLMLVITTFVAFFKRELVASPTDDASNHGKILLRNKKVDDINDRELDAAEIGLAETYHRLWAVCKLPAVQWLFLILLTYRLPTSLGDNVKFLKAVEYGLSKSTTAVRKMNCFLVKNVSFPALTFPMNPSCSCCHPLLFCRWVS
jgi:MFS transporter, PAT family, solute carrier family 33 (acetyl-CoA transportor), member 1